MTDSRFVSAEYAACNEHTLLAKTCNVFDIAAIHILEVDHGASVGHIGQVHGWQGLVQQAEGGGAGGGWSVLSRILSRGCWPCQGGTSFQHPFLHSTHAQPPDTDANRAERKP